MIKILRHQIIIFGSATSPYCLSYHLIVPKSIRIVHEGCWNTYSEWKMFYYSCLKWQQSVLMELLPYSRHSSTVFMCFAHLIVTVIFGMVTVTVPISWLGKEGRKTLSDLPSVHPPVKRWTRDPQAGILPLETLHLAALPYCLSKKHHVSIRNSYWILSWVIKYFIKYMLC